MVLTVTYILTPFWWVYRTALLSSSWSKFAAYRRSQNAFPPRYTASAQTVMAAALMTYGDPAGARNLGTEGIMWDGID